MGKKNNRKNQRSGENAPTTTNGGLGEDRVAGQDPVTEEREEEEKTELEEELNRIEQEIITVKKELVVCLRRNIQMCILDVKYSRDKKRDTDSVETLRTATRSLLKITNEFEQEDSTLGDFDKEARTALQQLMKTLEVFDWTKELKELAREFVTQPFVQRLEIIALRCHVYKEKEKLEELEKMRKEKMEKDREEAERLKDMEMNEFSYRGLPKVRKLSNVRTLSCGCCDSVLQNPR